MGKWNVIVGDFIPKMNFFRLEHNRSSNRVDWCISPPLVEEATILIQGGKVVNILVGPQPFQAANLKVGPLFSS